MRQYDIPMDKIIDRMIERHFKKIQLISYKRDVLERQSISEVKMGRGSPICERVRKKIVEYFKNNVPQCQIAKVLQIS